MATRLTVKGIVVIAMATIGGQTASAAPLIFNDVTFNLLPVTGLQNRVYFEVSTSGLYDMPPSVNATGSLRLDFSFDPDLAEFTSVSFDPDPDPTVGIDLTDFSGSINKLLVGGLDFDGSDYGFQLFSTEANTPPVATNVFKLSEVANRNFVDLNEGTFNYSGYGATLGQLGAGSLDFATDPLLTGLPTAPPIFVTFGNIVNLGSGLWQADISLPLTINMTWIDSPVEVNARMTTISGAIVARTIFAVPEPSAITLLGIAGAVGLVFAARRPRRTSRNDRPHFRDTRYAAFPVQDVRPADR